MNIFRRQKFIGRLKYAQFDSVSADKAIVVTEENVLAALSSKNGEILWRRILESDDSRGDVKLLHVTKDSRSIARGGDDGSDPFGVITVSGTNPVLFRGWDINNGNLGFEWSLTLTTESADSQYFFKGTNIYHILPVWNSHIELTEYHASSGQQTAATTSKITAGWITKDKCVLSGESFVCLTKNQLLILDLLSAQNNLRTKALDMQASSLQIVRGQEGFVQVDRQVISLKDLQVVYENKNLAELFMDSSLIQLVKTDNNIKITMEDQELTVLTDIPESIDNNLQIMSTKCKPKKENNQLVCRFLLSTDDGAIVLAQQGKIKWIREEALTRIAAVEFLDLTLSDAQGAIEEELNNKDGKLNFRAASNYNSCNENLFYISFSRKPEEKICTFPKVCVCLLWF
jgi:ER membrane protein complex subunit 1